MRLFVSALEYSANIHLKYLLCEMIKSENIELCGIFDESILDSMNGESAPFCVSGESLCNIESVGVMGFIDVLKRAKFFLQLRAKCVNLALSANKILLMDSSSFNIPLAKRVKKRDSSKEIMYYILPQVWAWKPWRAKVIEANCDKLAAILPFEVKCYEKKAKFVGHPLLDEIKAFRGGNSLENSSLGAPFALVENFGEQQTPSLVLSPKFSTNTKLPPQILELDSNANSAESSLRGESTDSPKQSTDKSIARSATLKALSGAGVGVVREGEGSDFAIQAPTPSLKKNARGQKGEFNADLSAESRNKMDFKFALDSRDLDSSLRATRYAQNDDRVDYFGQSHRNDESFVDCHDLPKANLAMTSNSDIFTFMPGSRLSEINRIFPIFLQVKDALKKRDSKAKFHLVVPKKFKGKNLSEIYGDLNDFHITFDAHTSLLQSTFAFICSGTATLECALIGTPFVLGYQGRWIEAFVVKQFLNIRFVGLANLLYSHIVPDSQFHIELLQENLTAQNLLDSYHNANPNDFLRKSLTLRAYLKSGSARAVAEWLLEK